MTNRVKFLALAAGLLFGTTSVYADSFVSTLNVFNVSGIPGPFGTVTVTTPSLNSSTAMITFSTAGTGYVLIDSNLADVNLNASSWTTSNLSWVTHTGDTSPTITADTGSSNVDGWGTFNQTFGTNSGFGSAVDSFTFTVTDTSGTFADAAAVLMANALGFDAAAHIAVLSSGGQVTGFAAESGGVTPPPAIPEPTTLALLGSGLAAIPALIRRRCRS